MLLLVLVQPWGLGLDWRLLSYATLAITGLWIAVSIRARREYLRSFRASIETRTITPDAVATSAGEAATVEAMVEELSSPDPAGVLYAIDMLEAMDKPHLVTPLLLRHESAEIRVRVLNALTSGRSRVAVRWRDTVERMTRDDDVDVRAAALSALASLAGGSRPAPEDPRFEDARPDRDPAGPLDGALAAMMSRHHDDPEPRVAVAAAAVLARSRQEGDSSLAESTFRRLIEDTRNTAVGGRVEAARALATTRNPQFRALIVPLLHDHHIDVVLAAIRGARALGASDGLFLPGLMARLGHRTLKNAARETLVAFGDEIVPALRYALENPHEHIWVRRHIPSTLALLPCEASMDALAASIDNGDGFLRYKVIAAMESIRRSHAVLLAPRAAVEARIMRASARYCEALTLRQNLLDHAPAPHDTLLERALGERLERTLDRIYRLMGVLYEVDDIAVARQAIEHGGSKRRTHAIEYLDNVLQGKVRKRIMPLIDETPPSAKVDHANLALKTRPRDLYDTLAQLIYDADPVISPTERPGRSPAHRPGVDLPGAALQPFDKAMILRRHPLLARAAPTELVALVSAGRELTLWEGETLFRDDDAACLYLVLEGIVQLESDGREPLVAGPGRHCWWPRRWPARRRASAVRACRILRADRDEVFKVLCHRTALLQDVFSGALAVDR